MTATGPHVPAIVTAPVTLPPDFTLHNIAALVRDVAVQLESMPAILKKHGLTPQQYDSLAGNEFFQRVLQDAIKNWHSPQSTKERVALAAAVALEDALPKIAARMTAGREDLADVVETAKLFADLAGMGPKANQIAQPTGEKFSININLSGDIQHIETTRPVAPGGGPLQIDAQIEGGGPAIRSFIEGSGQTVSISELPTVPPEPLSLRPLDEGNNPTPEGPIETGL